MFENNRNKDREERKRGKKYQFFIFNDFGSWEAHWLQSDPLLGKWVCAGYKNIWVEQMGHSPAKKERKKEE